MGSATLEMHMVQCLGDPVHIVTEDCAATVAKEIPELQVIEVEETSVEYVTWWRWQEEIKPSSIEEPDE